MKTVTSPRTTSFLIRCLLTERRYPMENFFAARLVMQLDVYGEQTLLTHSLSF